MALENLTPTPDPTEPLDRRTPLDVDAHRLVSEVIARYVRAADHRDPDRMAATFWEDATTTVFYSGNGRDELLAEIEGAETIGAAVVTGMSAHPARGWSHHTTLNPIVTVEGATAHYDAQFVVYNVLGADRPESGWPPGTSGAQGRITPIESGYIDSTLERRNGTWRLHRHIIKHDLPYAFEQG